MKAMVVRRGGFWNWLLVMRYHASASLCTGWGRTEEKALDRLRKNIESRRIRESRPKNYTRYDREL